MIEIPEKHKQAIKNQYKMAIKLNDVDAFEALLNIRKRARDLGYCQDEITKLFREARDD